MVYGRGGPALSAGPLRERGHEAARSAVLAAARFRPNFVFAGAPAWSEDSWTTLALNGLTFDAVKPCARCLVPTTDQRTGARDPQQEPLRTLATFRTIPGRGTIFGMNLVARGEGTVRL